MGKTMHSPQTHKMVFILLFILNTIFITNVFFFFGGGTFIIFILLVSKMKINSVKHVL